MPIPTPSTWRSGPVLAPQLRGDVSEAVAFLGRRPLFIGAQTTSTQSISNAADTVVALDTEVADTTGGHQIAANQGTWYGMTPGWYVAEAICPLNYTGGSGNLSVGVGGNQGGGSFGIFYGMSLPMASGFIPQCLGARLMQMVSTGVYGGGSNDYIRLYVNQNSGSSQNLLNGTGRYPQLYVRWACANSGTIGLPVPAPAAWPVPPAYVTSAFLNAQVRDVVRFLVYPPVTEWSYTGAGQNLASQNVVPSTGNTVNLDTMTVDNYGAFSNAANTWTAPVSGIYWLYGQVSLSAQPTSVAVAAGLTVNSANYNSGSTVTLWGGAFAAGTVNINSAIARRRLRLDGGDTVRLAGWQRDSGGNTAPVLGSGMWTSKLIAVWEAA